MVFSVRGVADLVNAEGARVTLGHARFTSGSVSYSVYFNSLGASKVEEG